ncbi:MAG: hypothetical protein LQ342_005025 [Letrouitia transgressa]|nr:MAG: hypothetical protein LQ342_005025 [Letrouitia transgressa]
MSYIVQQEHRKTYQNEDITAEAKVSDPNQQRKANTPSLQTSRKQVSGSGSLTETNRFLEDFFTADINQLRPQHASRYPPSNICRPRRRPSARARGFAILEPLSQKFFKGKSPLSEVWATCQELLDQNPSLADRDRLSEDDKRSRDLLLLEILLSITAAHADGSADPTLPEPAEAVSFYCDRHVMRYWWDSVLWKILGSLCKLIYDGPTGDLPQSSHPAQRLDKLMGQLLDIWTLFISKYRVAQTIEDLIKTRDPHLQSRLLSVLEKHPRRGFNDRTANMATCVALTENFLRSTRQSTARTARWTPETVRTVKLITSITEDAFFTRKDYQIAMAKLSDEEVEEQVVLRALERWEKVEAPVAALPTIATPLLGQEDPLSVKTHELHSENADRKMEGSHIFSEAQAERFNPLTTHTASSIGIERSRLKIDKILRIVETATARYNLKLVSTMWERFHSIFLSSKVSENYLEYAFRRFLTAFWALRLHDQAVHVWNTMIKFGIKPNTTHWSAMLAGCVKANDHPSLQLVWCRLAASGVKPDRICWAIWIEGLIRCGRYKQGLQALEGLGRLWRRTAEQKSKGSGQQVAAVREESQPNQPMDFDPAEPDIVIIDSTINALVKGDQLDLAFHVLKWAISHGIRMETSTFNLILRHAVRNSDEAFIRSILSVLSQHNCKPDSVTFSLILDGIMRHPNSKWSTQLPELQEATVLKILGDMEAHGLKANHFTYASVLDALLKGSYPNLLGARTVLQHMVKNDVKPSVQIYTILIGHYFAQDPPHLDALQATWQQIVSTKTSVDYIFYCVMIQGYAECGELEKMFYFLRRAGDEGKSPTWKVLYHALDAVVRAREWSLVGELVRDVNDPNGIRKYAGGIGALSGRRWEGEFWALAANVKERILEAG